MEAKSKYSLQRTMMVYFLLIGFAALLVGLEFIAETRGEPIRQAFLAPCLNPATTLADQAIYLQPLEHLRHKAVLVIAIIMVVILIVMTMFMKHITEPLQHMIAAARRISSGDLSPTIRIEDNNELAELGGVINEMASNLQEIIHMSRNTTNAGEAFLAAMAETRLENGQALCQSSALKEEMERFRLELDVLKTALDCFNCYAIAESRS